jgi:hypothetical protein
MNFPSLATSRSWIPTENCQYTSVPCPRLYVSRSRRRDDRPEIGSGESEITGQRWLSATLYLPFSSSPETAGAARVGLFEVASLPPLTTI